MIVPTKLMSVVHNLFSSLGQRQQTNQLTSYLDASSVYGSDQAEQNTLRTMAGGILITY